MKVTKELLERHGMGLCTKEEKKAVKEWFESLENPSAQDQAKVSQQINRERLWGRVTEIIPALKNGGAPVIPMYQKITRYAAAACIIFAAFFCGRFSANTVNANPVPTDPTSEHLFYSGSYGAIGNLPGSTFKIDFEGAIRLFNNSKSPKTIQVGDTSLILPPHQHFYLMGDVQNPELKLKTNLSFAEFGGDLPLEGYFSIQRKVD